MVVTMLEGRVPDDRVPVLTDEYGDAGDDLPPFIDETFLLHADDSDLWRIVTVWKSREALEEYRASVETPRGVLVFRAAGVEPTLTIFDVAVRAAQP
jgi:heme-degrading monooxygenase HmoA